MASEPNGRAGRTPAQPRRLRDVQDLFYDLVTAPAGVAAGLAARGIGAADLESVVRGDARLSAVDRLDVYANMYFYRILEVLSDEFPRTAAALGAPAFHNLITDYLLVQRPAHPSLREVGARLPDAIAGHALASARPWLADLARLERAHREVFDGADATALGLDDLRGLAPEDFVAVEVALVPARAMVTARFAVSTIWEIAPAAPDADADVPELTPDVPASACEAPARAPAPGRELIVVWRQGFAARHRAITDAAEESMLAMAADGATLGALCDRLIAVDGEASEAAADAAPARAFQILARWVDDGLLMRANPLARAAATPHK